MGKCNFYNLFSFFSYLLLLIKFPFLLLFDNTHDNLSIYFIVISFSIATNFFASDLFSYKKIENGINFNELILALVFFITSSLLVFYKYQNLLLIFLVYNFSLFLNSITIAKLRELKIIYLLYLEILVSFFQILASILLSVILNLNLGYSLIISTTFIYFVVFIVLSLLDIVNILNINVQNKKKFLSINLYFDMIITQYERLLLSVYLSNTLVFINIISSLVNGIKRFVFDDNLMHKSIDREAYDFNKIAIRFSLTFFLINFLLLYLYSIKFLDSTMFLKLMNNIKPDYIAKNYESLFVIAALYFGINPISFFVSHHFRNGNFKLINFLIYLPILLFFILFTFNIIQINQNFLLVLILFTTIHFLLSFVFLSKDFYRLNKIAFIFLFINYIFGFFCSMNYSFSWFLNDLIK